MITTTVEMSTPSLEEIKDAWNVTRKTVVTGEQGWKILQRCPSFKFKGSNVGYISSSASTEANLTFPVK